MKRLFVESSLFARRVNEAGVEVLKEIQLEILKNPEGGRVIQGTGGMRKLRVRDEGRGKGKRGGFRVIYLDLPEVERTHLLALFDKNEKDDISKDEKKSLKALVEQIKKEAR
jgi:hypothetical protein